MSFKPTLIRQAVRRWAKQSDFTWRYMLNLGPTLSYSLDRTRLDDESARVLADLNRDGIAITSADALLRSRPHYREILEAAQRLQIEQAEEISAARDACAAGEAAAQKPFLYCLLGADPRIETLSVFTRFALETPVADIANAYFGMHCALSTYNIWLNFLSGKAPFQSQLWHRDPEDRYILKVFLCLSDVDDGAGPFTYAPGTHPKGGVRRTPEYLHKDGQTTRSDDRQMDAVIPSQRWVKGTGPIGTMIFADTRGFHKGGLSRERERLLYIAEFLSPMGGHGVSTRGGVS
jgi:hypothetical protein